MNVLTTSTENQTITFVPRSDVLAGRIILVEKDTRDTIVINASFSVVGNYTEAVASFNLVEDSRYSFTVISNSVEFYNRVLSDNGTIESLSCVDEAFYLDGENEEVIYRGMIICTNQSEYDRYDIQQGEFVQANTSDNEYIVVNDD